MPAVNLLEKPVVVDGDQKEVVVDGQAYPCEPYHVDLTTAQGVVTIWLPRQRNADSPLFMVLCGVGVAPMLFEVNDRVVEMLVRYSAYTVVIWMCHAARLEL